MQRETVLHGEDKRDGLSLAIALVCPYLPVVACGLALRGFGRDAGSSAFVVKYGGSLLWGTMLFLLVAILAPRQRWQSVGWTAMSVAVCVELSRLIHPSWLDSFRLTMAGALLPGRIFSPWNIAAYGRGSCSARRWTGWSVGVSR
jgi:hypothetical protein